MPYTPTTWVNDSTDLDAPNLNKLETAVEDVTDLAEDAIPKPVAPATNAGLVWNGSTWVAAKLVDANVDAAAAIAASKLAGYPSDATKFLNGSGAWSVPVGAVTKIGELVGDGASADFTSIPQTYRHLLVIGQVSLNSASAFDLLCRINNVSSGDYHRQRGSFVTTTAAGLEAVSQTSILIGPANTNWSACNFVMFVPNYAQSGGSTGVNNKMVFGLFTALSAAVNSAGSFFLSPFGGVLGTANSAITRLTFLPSTGSFDNSNIVLYGMS